jgi:predicted dehydrogenase
VRALVVGLGRMGTFHRRALRDLGYQVDAVDYRGSTGAEYSSIQEALLRHDYDVAAVAVPIPHLVESAFQLAGIPMLVEKPFASNAHEAAMLGAYLSSRSKVCVGYVERFNPCVRELRERLSGVSVRAARFTRWSDRPSVDLVTDLLTHDVDLARHLRLDWSSANGEPWDRVTFDTQADKGARVRQIEVDVVVSPDWSFVDKYEETWTVDLMAHDQSPLHALWHAFLTGAEVPGPDDAVAALEGAQVVSARTRVEAVLTAAEGGDAP